MVSGKYKARTYARKRVVTPGGKNVLRHSLRKPKKARSAQGELLHGVARARPGKLRKLSKSQRVPSRPFAGQLSSRESRRTIIKRARARK